jgi:hypothetical protein
MDSVGIFNPRTNRRMVKMEKSVPLKGFPEIHAKTATDRTGKHKSILNVLVEGTHFIIKKRIRR